MMDTYLLLHSDRWLLYELDRPRIRQYGVEATGMLSFDQEGPCWLGHLMLSARCCQGSPQLQVDSYRISASVKCFVWGIGLLLDRHTDDWLSNRLGIRDKGAHVLMRSATIAHKISPSMNENKNGEFCIFVSRDLLRNSYVEIQAIQVRYGRVFGYVERLLNEAVFNAQGYWRSNNRRTVVAQY